MIYFRSMNKSFKQQQNKKYKVTEWMEIRNRTI